MTADDLPELPSVKDLTAVTAAGSVSRVDAFEYAIVSQIVIRACSRCGGKREDPDAPCPGCGNPERAVVDELGVTGFVHRDPERAAWWFRAGRLRADARIRRANKNAERLRSRS